MINENKEFFFFLEKRKEKNNHKNLKYTLFQF